VQVAPVWAQMAAVIEDDKEMVEKLGWVREMYGFSVAMAVEGVKVRRLECFGYQGCL
jgi:hypothetical protein